MHQTTRSVLTALLVISLLAGCAAPAAPAGSADPTAAAPTETAAGQSPAGSTESTGPIDEPGLAISAVARLDADPALALLAAEAINELGFDLLRTGTDGTSNAVLSPASIALALAMARAGARGDTAAEMDEVMRNVASDEHAAWLAALDAALADRAGTYTTSQGNEHVLALRIVNAPFAQVGFPWEQPYLDALAARFSAGVRLVDYARNSEAARLAINGWVDEQTERRIPELLKPGVVDDATRIVLVNAIYLKAAWLAQFREAATTSGPFHRLDGSTVDVPMMHASRMTQFAEGDGWFAVDLPYVGEQLSMLLIVPEDLQSFEAGLDATALTAVVDGLESDHLGLSMPRFGIETELDLNETLAGLGMPSAFDRERADFSGMTAADRLYIQAVVHQANIDVDEGGTEASAATGVVAGIVSMPRPITIDRPFLFALRDRGTGAILFLGRVVEPVER